MHFHRSCPIQLDVLALILQSIILMITVLMWVWKWLDQCRLKIREENVQGRLAGVVTPLKLAQWEYMLAHHPDREYVAYILSGIQEGFRVGYQRGDHG